MKHLSGRLDGRVACRLSELQLLRWGRMPLLRASPRQMRREAAAGMEPVPALTPFVEEHAHFDEKDPEGSVRSALAATRPRKRRDDLVSDFA